VITPKGGGVGLLAALCVVGGASGFPRVISAAAAGLAAISLVGDRVELSPQFRLVMQTIAAAGASLGMISLVPAAVASQWSAILAWLFMATFFIMATANIYNFMDGINGIAGITGVVAFGVLAIVGCARGERPEWILIAASLAAACAGFLPWNVPTAKVFMGDVGSILLGFMFAVYVLAWSRSTADVLMFSSFLLPFYADETGTVVVRWRTGEPLMTAHRRHIYQILANQQGVAHWKIALTYGAIQCGIAAVAVLIRPVGWIAEGAFWLLALAVLWAWGTLVRKHEFA